MSTSSTVPFFSAHAAMLSITSSARRMSLCSCVKNFVDFMITPFGPVPDWNGKDRDIRVATQFRGRGAKKDSIHTALSADRQYDEINDVFIRDPGDHVSRYSFGKDRFNFHLAAPCLRLNLRESGPRVVHESLLFSVEH